MYFVAHEDDDLLFMNPDISSSIERGNHVVVVHLTAGDLTKGEAASLADHPTTQQYWMDRERGSINAYTFMAHDEGDTAYVPGSAISAPWVAQAIDVAGVRMIEYDLTQDASTVSLVFLRLSDLQLENAWLNKPGLGGQAAETNVDPKRPLPPGSVQTVACTGCPLGTDLGRQVVTRDQLARVLEGLILRFTAASPGSSSVSFQDASGLYIDSYGTAAACNPAGHDHGASCGYRDYWDHVFGARFVLAAALAVQVEQPSLALREYRDYTISQVPPTLSTCPRHQPWCSSETTTKTQIMAFYGLYDDGLVDHAGTGFSVTEPSFQKAVSARNHHKYDPVANIPRTFDELDGNAPRAWVSRQVEMQSVTVTSPQRGRLTANGACIGYDGISPRPIECANAPLWELTPAGQIELADEGQCLTIVRSPTAGSARVALVPCTPATVASMMVLFDTGQIRTADAGCLSMTSQLTSIACTNPRDIDPAKHRHAAGIPTADQAWTLISSPATQ